jgi:hypothetical protein
MTLVELSVAMVVMTGVLIGFMFMYLMLNRSGQGTTQLTASQSSTRLVERVLEADIRSADPLEYPQLAANITPGQFPGTADTDYVAMFETIDGYSPCQTTPTPPSVPTGPLPFVTVEEPNVVWSYAASTGILTRWSYVSCGAGSPSWHSGLQLRNVIDPAGTMFSLTGVGTQTATTVAGEVAVPSCADAVSVNMKTTTRSQTTPFKLNVTLPLPNQQSVEDQACS